MRIEENRWELWVNGSYMAHLRIFAFWALHISANHCVTIKRTWILWLMCWTWTWCRTRDMQNEDWSKVHSGGEILTRAWNHGAFLAEPLEQPQSVQCFVYGNGHHDLCRTRAWFWWCHHLWEEMNAHPNSAQISWVDEKAAPFTSGNLDRTAEVNPCESLWSCFKIFELADCWTW